MIIAIKSRELGQLRRKEENEVFICESIYYHLTPIDGYCTIKFKK